MSTENTETVKEQPTKEVIQMSIARAMTRMDTIISQCKRLEEEIGKYSVWSSKEKFPLADQTVPLDKNHRQAREYIQSKFQQHRDLISQLMVLKTAVNEANMTNSFTIGDKTFTISGWLYYKQEVKTRIAALNSKYTGCTSLAEMKVIQYNSNISSKIAEGDRETMLAEVVYFIPKNEIESQAIFLNEFLTEINGRLNEVNNQIQISI